MSSDTFTQPTDPADAKVAMMRQLTERAAHDPLAGLLLTRLQSVDTVEEPDPLDVLERRFDAALRANQKLREALVAANEMTSWIARLIGACPQCWGLVSDCSACSGRGGPGYEQPAVSDLVDWLAPALHRAGLTFARPQPIQPPNSSSTHTTTEQEMS